MSWGLGGDELAGVRVDVVEVVVVVVVVVVGEEGETQHQVPARTPPNRPRAPRTHRRDTAPAKAVVAHSATPQPLG